jgi:hypothetical protein
MPTSVLLGLEVSPTEIGVFAVFGVLMAGVGYFVAKSSRPASSGSDALPFGMHPGMRELTGPGSEQRQHPRYEIQPFKLRMTLNGGRQEIEGLVLNQSLGGLCICVPESLPEGAVLHLHGAEKSPNRPKSQVIIKHCRPHRGGWALGCQYL